MVNLGRPAGQHPVAELGWNHGYYPTSRPHYCNLKPQVTTQYNKWVAMLCSEGRHAHDGVMVGNEFLTYEGFYPWATIQKGFEYYDTAMNVLDPFNRIFDKENTIFVARPIGRFWSTTYSRFTSVHPNKSMDEYIAGRVKRGKELCTMYRSSLDERVREMLLFGVEDLACAVYSHTLLIA